MRMEGVRLVPSAPARRPASLGCRSGRRGATTCYHEPAQKGASERKATEREARETPAKAGMQGNQRERAREAALARSSRGSFRCFGCDLCVGGVCCHFAVECC